MDHPCPHPHRDDGIRGTREAANWCAPSRSGPLLGSINHDRDIPGMLVNYEIAHAYLAVASGMRVVFTDSIGLGNIQNCLPQGVMDYGLRPTIVLTKSGLPLAEILFELPHRYECPG